MHKNKKGRKFGRIRDQRQALMKSLARALILNEKVNTTEAKAKELRVYIEPIITKTKENSLQATRFLARLFDNSARKKLISDIAPRYKNRKGGYTRIIKRMPRRHDSARMAVIEFV